VTQAPIIGLTDRTMGQMTGQSQSNVAIVTFVVPSKTCNRIDCHLCISPTFYCLTTHLCSLLVTKLYYLHIQLCTIHAMSDTINNNINTHLTAFWDYPGESVPER